MDMQTGTCFSHRNFRSESDVVSILVSKVTDNPFGNHQLVGCLLGTYRQKFDFVLLVYLTVKGEITHFGMSVLNLSAGLCDISHAFGTEFVEFGIRSRLVITTLVGSREHPAVFRNNIIFQLTHSLKLHARYFRKCPASLAQGMFR